MSTAYSARCNICVLKIVTYKVNRNKLWTMMEEQGYPQHLMRAIRSLYHNSKIIINKRKNKTEEIIINKGVRQGRSISPTLFNIHIYIYIYINDIVQKWKRNISPGIKLSREISLKFLLYADDVVIIQRNEDDLQRSVHHLNQICKQYNFKISIEKIKVMAFWGKHPIRSKIVL
jgi:hypothetical protein